eukprot:7279232-Pyramimonas_sp.AAC.1
MGRWGLTVVTEQRTWVEHPSAHLLCSCQDGRGPHRRCHCESPALLENPDLNPEGLTAATGKWANALADRLKKGNLSCHVRPFLPNPKPTPESLNIAYIPKLTPKPRPPHRCQLAAIATSFPTPTHR